MPFKALQEKIQHNPLQAASANASSVVRLKCRQCFRVTEILLPLLTWGLDEQKKL